MNKDRQLAHHILDAVGGIDNVDNIIHCMTRVRLKINNETQVDYPKLKNIEACSESYKMSDFKLWSDLER